MPGFELHSIDPILYCSVSRLGHRDEYEDNKLLVLLKIVIWTSEEPLWPESYTFLASSLYMDATRRDTRRMAAEACTITLRRGEVNDVLSFFLCFSSISPLF